MEVAICQQYAEGGVEGQEGLQYVLLIPEAEGVNDPVSTVFKREKYVVHLDYDAGLQTRQDLEEEESDVTADACHV